MNKIYVFFSFFCFILILYFFSYKDSYVNFAQLPILHDGRIKPMETFAKSNFNKFFKKEKSIYYSKYIADIIFDFDSFSKKEILNINNKELLFSIGIKTNYNNIYSFDNIFDALFKNIEFIDTLLSSEYNKLTYNQQLLVQLYYNINIILSIKDNFKFINYEKNILLENLSNKIQVNNYIYLIHDDMNKWFSFPEALKIEDNDSIKNKLDLLFKMNDAYKKFDINSWVVLSNDLKRLSVLDLNFWVSFKLYLENVNNKVNFLFNSLIFYLIFFIYNVLFNTRKYFSSNIFYAIFSFALLFSTFDILFRLLISGRPPVTNLYESIVFVNLVCSFCFILFANKIKSYFGFIVIAFGLFLLQLIGYNYNYDAEIKNLVSVLNTNFWLILHVLTITAGYACCLISSLFAHIYFYQHLKYNSIVVNENKIFDKMYLFLLLALFFSFNGTVLGGIWADQSWGRFWGWDPKENGALLVVLWLVLILHLKIVTRNKCWISIMTIMLSITVALAWFGVNILNVGLHSYGFTQNVSIWLLVFIFFELFYICLLPAILRFKLS